jgi:hypothetical protein
MFALTADCSAFVPTMADCIVKGQAYKPLHNDCSDPSIHCIHHAICSAVVFEGQQ